MDGLSTRERGAVDAVALVIRQIRGFLDEEVYWNYCYNTGQYIQQVWPELVIDDFMVLCQAEPPMPKKRRA